MAGSVSFPPMQVRAALESLVERDLLGPWDGPDEELVAGQSPAERYLLGRLVPRPPERSDEAEPMAGDGGSGESEEFVGPELMDREVLTGTGDDEPAGDDVPEATTRFGSMAASSLGLSFMVPEDVDVVAVEASWGRYERAASEHQETPTGRPAVVWRRRPAGGRVEVRLGGGDPEPVPPDPDQDQVVLTARADA